MLLIPQPAASPAPHFLSSVEEAIVLLMQNVQDNWYPFLNLMTRVFGALPPRAVEFLMSNVFSPKGMSYALVGHNHFKVGYTVREVIDDARKYGINAPRPYAVESLIAK